MHTKVNNYELFNLYSYKISLIFNIINYIYYEWTTFSAVKCSQNIFFNLKLDKLWFIK